MNNNKKSNYWNYYPILLILFLCSFWIICHPLSKECAEKSFYSYLVEYNTPKEDIISLSINKDYTFSYTVISVKFSGDPEYTYRYYYEIISCIFINEPKLIEVLYADVYVPSEEQYSNLKYPLITQDS